MKNTVNPDRNAAPNDMNSTWVISSVIIMLSVVIMLFYSIQLQRLVQVENLRLVRLGIFATVE